MPLLRKTVDDLVEYFAAPIGPDAHELAAYLLSAEKHVMPDGFGGVDRHAVLLLGLGVEGGGLPAAPRPRIHLLQYDDLGTGFGGSPCRIHACDPRTDDDHIGLDRLGYLRSGNRIGRNLPRTEPRLPARLRGAPVRRALSRPSGCGASGEHSRDPRAGA